MQLALVIEIRLHGRPLELSEHAALFPKPIGWTVVILLINRVVVLAGNGRHETRREVGVLAKWGCSPSGAWR